MNKIRVLVVDDSALMRYLIAELLSSSPRLEVVGKARDGAEALNLIKSLSPDVLTLDVEMPKMNGVETLRAMQARPKPRVVMLSSLTTAGAELTMQCLALGAFDFVAKPSGSTSLDIDKTKDELVAKVIAAGDGRLGTINPSAGVPSFKSPVTHATKCRQTVVIGSSTGGPRALLALIPSLPANIGVPIVIVQHMPENFTKPLADRLNQLAPFPVKEVEVGDQLTPGQVLVARGGHHLEFDHLGRAHLTKSSPVHAVRPSIDVTIASMAKTYASQMVGVILTGMGKDGAAGMKAVHEAHGHTIAEHESTCAVYGMPRAVVELHAADQVLPLSEIPQGIADAVARIHKRIKPETLAS